MARFVDAATGREVLIPYRSMLACRAGDAGLTTQVITVAGPIEVMGTFDTVAKALEDEALFAGASGWSTVGGAQ